MILEQQTFEKYGYYPNDLGRYSGKSILFSCDYCKEIKGKIYSNYLNERNKNTLVNKDACGKCSGLKIKEMNKLKGKNYVIPENKKCSKCNITKPLTSKFFNKDKTSKTGFKYKCKECLKIESLNKKAMVEEIKFKKDQAMEIYLKNIKEDSFLPNKFWDKIDNLQDFMIELMNIYIRDIDSLPKIFDSNFVQKNRLIGFVNKFNSYFESIDFIYPNRFKAWEFKSTSNKYWKNKDNIIFALKWFVEKLAQDDLIKTIDELPKVCSYKLFVKYNLGGLVTNHFNASPFHAINFLYPDKFKEWEFNTPKHFMTDDSNKTRILHWFIEKLLEEKIITSIEDIPERVDINTFENYNLGSFVRHNFDGVSYKAFNFLFPDKWHPWEFKSCPIGYWKDKNNVKHALEWFVDRLIERGTIDSVDQLRNLPVTKLFSEFNLLSISKEYNNNYGLLFSTILPNYFSLEDFGKNFYAFDGTKLDSKEEVLIHEWLISNCKKVMYFNNNGKQEFKWHNEKMNENYVADWMINDNIIIEYFGWYNPTSKHQRYVSYNNKVNRKIDYFNGLDNFKFVPLFPKDIRKNLEGVRNKIKEVI